MITYLVRRILAMIPTLLGITFVTFLIMNLAPGDPVSTRFAAPEGGGDAEGASRERMADAIRAKKKLLGMVRESHALLAWEGGRPPGGDETRGEAPEIEFDEPIGSFEGWAKALAAAPDGSLWVGGDERLLRHIDAGGDVLAELSGHESMILAIAVAVDGSRVISSDGDGVVRAWSGAGAEIFRVEVAPLPVRDLAVLPDGSVLAASDDGVLTLLSPEGAELARIDAHVGAARAIAVSADGATAWSAGADRQVREWDLASATVRRVVHEGGQVNDLVLAPAGDVLYSGGDDRRIWRIPLDGVPAELGQHYGPVTALALSPDGSALYSGGRDEIMRRWELPSGRLAGQTRIALGAAWDIVVLDGDRGVLTVSDSWLPVALPERYLSWLSRMVRLDFDRSFKDDQPVMDKMMGALKVTLALNVLAILIIYAIAVPLGVLAAARRGSAFDHVSSVMLFLLYSIPSFWLATLLILTFSSRTAWDILPSVGLASRGHEDLSYLSWLLDRARHLVLPLAVMTYAGFASLSRYARTSMLETIGQDYIRTARAKGLSERVVLWKHAFRNSLVTIVTLVGNLLPAMIGGSVIVESIFSINGMGKLGFEAILARDYPVVMAITTFSALLTLLGILISDILYTVVDPRITHS